MLHVMPSPEVRHARWLKPSIAAGPDRLVGRREMALLPGDLRHPPAPVRAARGRQLTRGAFRTGRLHRNPLH